MTGLRTSAQLLSCAALLSWGATYLLASAKYGGGSGQDQGAATKQPAGKEAEIPATLPRGKKLMLKDGTFQLVREYQRQGERVRYYSVERAEWEEIPAAMVDWDATAKAEASDTKAEASLVKKVHIQDEEARSEAPLDIDASLTVAPGVFLPPGEGMFAIEGKVVKPLEQVGSEVKVDKKRVLEQVLSPIPIVPSKHNIDIPGARAKIRILTAQPEFYLREAPPDPDRTSPIVKSSRPGESGPEIELVRAKVKGNKRVLETIRSLFGQQLSEDRNTISMQRWDVAATVYRFTLSQPLPPGEYALAEILPDGMNLYVWDFGVDRAPGAKAVGKQNQN